MQNNQPLEDWVRLQMQELPAFCTYHTYGHCLYVRKKAEEIGRHEGTNNNEMRLLTTAALWHDVGHIHTSEGHEEEGCKLARLHLPAFHFSEHEIELICGMVMATKMPQSPTTKLEAVIADADLAYLGTADAGRQAENVFREWQALDRTLTREEWNRRQIDFLERHRYFTAYAQKVFQPGKEAYLQSLKTILSNTNESQ